MSICPTEPPEDWTEKCRSTKNMTLFEAVKLMRGKKGSKITIDIFREGFDRPKPFQIVRDIVKVVSVSSRMLERGYGYLRLRAFQEKHGGIVSQQSQGTRVISYCFEWSA